jgi:thioredoxin-related protein
MKQKLFLTALLTVVALKMLVAQSAADSVKPGWLTDYKTALATAQREKKTVLMDFTGSDWCGWCIKLRREVFDTTEFSRYAKDNLVLLEVDFPQRKPQSEELRRQNQELMRQFNVEGFPTILLLNADGKQIGQTGYVPGGPQRFIENINSIKAKTN